MIAIVGAGPSGLSAALYLSHHGKDVTVIDRFSESGYDRYHSICGAGISGSAFRELELISPDNIRNRIDRAELCFPGGNVVEMKVEGYVLDRPAFLKGLRDRCIRQGCRFIRSNVSSVSRTYDGFEVIAGDEIIRCTHVIGCDGAHSIVRRCLFGSRPEMIPVDEFIVEGECHCYRITLGEKYQGLYEWAFPAGEHTSIGSGKGILSPDDVISKGSRHIPFGGVERISDNDAYLCGDAAGMANPVSFGGLRAALVSGQEAAREILTGRSYQRWWDRSILSSRRFMDFRRRLTGWDDRELEKASHLISRGNIYLWGVLSGIIHPTYIPMYIGCLKTFRHSW